MTHKITVTSLLPTFTFMINIRNCILGMGYHAGPIVHHEEDRSTSIEFKDNAELRTDAVNKPQTEPGPPKSWQALSNKAATGGLPKNDEFPPGEGPE